MNGPDAFPCPFCCSKHVELVGSGLVFLHYRCVECAEVWTAMASRPAVGRPRLPASDQVPLVLARTSRKAKVWSH
jgi:transposase-like protein